MKKLDQYIIKQYLFSFFFTMLLITMMAVVIDFSEKIGKFIDADLSIGLVVSQYYLNFIPWINGLMWPLFALIAVIFFTSRLAKNSEVIALLSSGISFNRILVPYLVAASIIAGLLWFGKNYVIPNSSKIKNDFEYEHLSKKHQKTLNNDIHIFLSPTEKVYIRYYRKRDTSGQTFRHETFDNVRLKKVIKAEQLKFKEAPNLWTLKNFEIRTFDGLSESIVVDGESMDTLLDLTPADFIRNEKSMENMTTSDLREHIRREQERGIGAAKNFLVQLHQRNAGPFSILILTLIGVSISSRKVRGGMGLHLAMGITLGAAYVVLSQFSSTFSINMSMSPMLGAWLPNIIFTFIAIILIRFSQK